MNEADVREIVEAALREHQFGDNNRPETLMPLAPFKAFSASCNPVDVIGVGQVDDMLQFMVVEEEDGEIFPIFRERIFRNVESARRTASAEDEGLS